MEGGSAMFPKFISPVILVALLSACAAPQTPPSRSAPVGLPTGEGLGVRETSTPTSAVIFPTETLAPTSTSTVSTSSTQRPEPTATPEPTVIQEEITFETIDGVILPMTCFLKNIPENASSAQKEQIDKELLETILKYFVDKGVDWGNGYYSSNGTASKEHYELWKNINLIPGKESAGGWFPVRASGANYEDFFGMNIMRIPHEGKDASLIAVKVPNKDFPSDYVCAEISPETASNLIRNNLIDIPVKPTE
jgi:hypothetical protein